MAIVYRIRNGQLADFIKIFTTAEKFMVEFRREGKTFTEETNRLQAIKLIYSKRKTQK